MRVQLTGLRLWPPFNRHKDRWNGEAGGAGGSAQRYPLSTPPPPPRDFRDFRDFRPPLDFDTASIVGWICFRFAPFTMKCPFPSLLPHPYTSHVPTALVTAILKQGTQIWHVSCGQNIFPFRPIISILTTFSNVI